MLTAKDLQPAGVQTVVFISDPQGFTANHLLESVLPRFSDRYDAEPISLPLAEDAPAEIPRVVLQSKDGAWRLQAGPSRIDSFLRYPDCHVLEAVSRCAEATQTYMEQATPVVGRLAVVVTSTAPAESPSSELISVFCTPSVQDGPLKGSLGFELHNHGRCRLAETGLQANFWMRCKTGILLDNEQQSPGVIVEQDINTPSENVPDSSFTANDFGTFLRDAVAEAVSLLDQYFPGGS